MFVLVLRAGGQNKGNQLLAPGWIGFYLSLRPIQACFSALESLQVTIISFFLSSSFQIFN